MSTFWLITSDFKIVRKKRKFCFWQFTSYTTPVFFFSWKMEVSRMKALSFFFQYLKTKLKNLIISTVMTLWNYYTDFFSTKSAELSIIRRTWKLKGILFQKLSWCTTTVPNFQFLAYSDPEIWAVGYKDPLDPHKQEKNEGLIELIDKRFM